MRQRLLLTLVLAAGFLLKVPALPKPLVGHFGSYQVMNGMMAEMMTKDPIPCVFVPTTLKIVEGKPGLHLLYYPFGSAAAALAQSLFGGNLDFWGRFQAALFMLLAAWIVFGIAKQSFDSDVALLASLVFTFSPMALISGTSFQNEAAALFFLVASFWTGTFPSSWGKLISGLLFSLALVARVHFVFLLPAFLLLLLRDQPRGRNVFLWAIGLVIPASAWYGWIYYLDRKSAHVMTSFFSQLGEGRVLVRSLLVNPLFYKRLLETFAGPWVTPVLFPFAVAGLFLWRRERAIFILWVLGCLATVVFLPQKVFDHPFYLISGLPAVSILAALPLRSFLVRFKKKAGAVVFSLFLLLTLRYYLPPAFSGSAAERRIPRLASEIASLTQPDDLVVVPNAAFLYYAKRFGWNFDLEMEKSSVFKSSQARHVRLVAKGYGDPVTWLEQLRKEGAHYLVIPDTEQFKKKTGFYQHVTQRYPSVEVPGQSFLLFDLKKEIASKGEGISP